MRITDIHVQQFGVLSDLQLNDLSPGLTVIHGTNGSGKTTLMQCLRGTLHGFAGETIRGFLQGETGEATLTATRDGRSYQLHRCGRGNEPNTTTLRIDGEKQPYTHEQLLLPATVTQSIFDEVFTVGDREAQSFGLLTSLALAGDDQNAVIETRVREMERRIEELRAERLGDGARESLDARTDRLRTESRGLESQLAERLAEARRIPEELDRLTAQLQSVHARMDSFRTEMLQAEQQLGTLIAELEQLRADLPIAIDDTELRREHVRLSERLSLWTRLRADIEADLNALAANGVTGRRAVEGVSPVQSLEVTRAMMHQVEARVEQLRRTLSVDASLRHVVSADGIRDEDGETFVPDSQRSLDRLTQEIFTLCAHLSQHEASARESVQSMEAADVRRSLESAAGVESQLRQRIAGLEAEIAAAADPTAAEHHSHRSPWCDSAPHAEFVQKGIRSLYDEERELQLERQIETLNSRQEQLLRELQQLETDASSQEQRIAAFRATNNMESVNAAIAELRSRIAELKESISQIDRREQELLDLERTLTEELNQLKLQRVPSTLSIASDYLRRLTEGDCYKLTADPARNTLLVSTSQSSQPRPLEHQSRGTRDLAGLALRLALAETFARNEHHVPLILDDVFISADDGRAVAAAELVRDVANRGQQIIFLTCHADVRELLVRHGADLRRLTERTATQPIPIPPPKPTSPPPERYIAKAAPIVTFDKRSVIDSGSIVSKTLIGDAEECPGEMSDRDARPSIPLDTNRPEAHWLFYLELDSAVETLSGISSAEVTSLASMGIRTIGDLLTFELEDAVDAVTHAGIRPQRFRDWQAQSSLAIRVPMLRRHDAELLVASGIRSLDALQRLQPEDVYETVRSFLATENGRRYLRIGSDFDRQYAFNWRRWSGHARSMDDARRSRSWSHRTAHRNGRSPISDAGRSAHDREDGDHSAGESGSAARRRRRPESDAAAIARRTRRIARRSNRQTLNGSDSDSENGRERSDRNGGSHSRSSSNGESRSQSESTSQSSGNELTFYLHRSSEVEAAPSIGPKTAERLAKVRIITVNDLLNANAAAVAEKLGRRRITEQTIRDWQDQARLVCCIPELRGHDAQILVACGIRDASSLAAKRPNDLFAEVAPFVETSAGQRIVRNGRKPDLQEIKDWIAWAGQSRSLKAA